MAELTIFAKRLKEARINANLKQNQLAEKAGITTATISAYESSDGSKGKNPSLDKAVDLAKTLKVSLDWLCGLKNEEFNNDLGAITQLSDILKIIVNMSDFVQETTVTIDHVRYKDDVYDMAAITFNNEDITNFVKTWEKMRNLYNDGTVDETIYKTWLEAEIKKYEKKPINLKIKLEEVEDILLSGELPF